MKKKIVCALAAGMLLCLAGCGATKEEQAQDMPVMSATQEQSEKAEATPEPFQYFDYGYTQPEEISIVYTEDRDRFDNPFITVDGKTLNLRDGLGSFLDAGFYLVDSHERISEQQLLTGACGDWFNEDGTVWGSYRVYIRYDYSADSYIEFVAESDQKEEHEGIYWKDIPISTLYVLGYETGSYDVKWTDWSLTTDGFTISAGDYFEDVLEKIGTEDINVSVVDSGYGSFYWWSVYIEGDYQIKYTVHFKDGYLFKFDYEREIWR